MKFDVIIGDPPHQPSDGGNDASAMPTYQKFVEQAKRLDPRPLVIAAPSRWFFDGRGLGARRSEMPHDRRIRKLVGYGDAGERLPAWTCPAASPTSSGSGTTTATAPS